MTRARQEQVDLAATPYYHCISRCVRRAFLCGKDDFSGNNYEHRKYWIVGRIKELASIFAIDVCSYAVLSNHYHILIRVGKIPLGELMRKVLSGYASQYNRRYKRVGYVFQNRYKSILCNEETYLLELVRYIHLNPVRAKITATLAELDRYKWTGHAVLMGNKTRTWQEQKEILTRFGRTRSAAIKHYRSYIQEGMKRKCIVDLSGGGLIRSYGGWENLLKQRRDHETRIGDERILGESDFVEQALKEDELQMTEQSRLQRKGWTLERLVRRVCKEHEIDPSEIMYKGRINKISVAKNLICHWGRSKLGLTATELALRLNISTTAVAKATQKGRQYAMESRASLEDLC